MGNGSARATRSPLQTALAASVCVGLAEWLVRSRAESALRQAGAARGILAVLAAYGLLGVIVGLLARRGSARAPAPSAALAWPAAALALASTASRALYDPVALVAGGALSALIWIAIRRLSGALGGRPERLPWPGLALGLLALALVTTATRAPDGAGRGAAIAGGLLVLAGAVAWLLSGAAGLWRNRIALLAAGSGIFTAALLAGHDPAAPSTRSQAGAGPSVLLITIDTLRADHVGAYGYSAARTPNLDALAQRGVRFAQTVAPTTITGPSHATILTGRLPEELGMTANRVPLPAGNPTLADRLGRAGYATGAFVSGWTASAEASGLPARFFYYDDDFRSFRALPECAYQLLLLRYVKLFLRWRGIDFSPLRRDARAVTDPAVRWLGRVAGRPFFAWVHYFDPHLPYDPPQRLLSPEAAAYRGPVDGHWYRLDAAQRAEILSSKRNTRQMLALYDAQIAFVDEQIGRLLEAARRASNGDLWIVATADHGENMGEQQLFWKRDLYDSTLLVPLIIEPPPKRAPEIAPHVVQEQVRLVDLTPTILDLLGIPMEAPLSGRSLVPWLLGARTGQSGPAWSVNFIDVHSYQRPRFSLRDHGWKLLRRLPGWEGQRWLGREDELYDLRADPGETTNLAAHRPGMLGSLETSFQHFFRGASPSRRVLDPRDLERLRRLGYVQ